MSVHIADSLDRTESVVSSGDLVGRRVLSEDGHRLGEVVRLVIDMSTWQVSMIAVRLRRSLLEPLGLEKPFLGSQIVWIRVDEISPGPSLILGRPLADLQMRFAPGEHSSDLDESAPSPPPG